MCLSVPAAIRSRAPRIDLGAEGGRGIEATTAGRYHQVEEIDHPLPWIAAAHRVARMTDLFRAGPILAGDHRASGRGRLRIDGRPYGHALRSRHRIAAGRRPAGWSRPVP